VNGVSSNPDAWRTVAMAVDTAEACNRATRPGSSCSSCGTPLWSPGGLCPHHACQYGGEWARANRVWCDLFHRGIPIPRLPERERADEFWETAGT
jgi:hypothetical protein